MSDNQITSNFNDLKHFVQVVNTKDISTPALAMRVRDILNRSKNSGGGRVSLKQAVIIARAIEGLTK